MMVRGAEIGETREGSHRGAYGGCDGNHGNDRFLDAGGLERLLPIPLRSEILGHSPRSSRPRISLVDCQIVQPTPAAALVRSNGTRGNPAGPQTGRKNPRTVAGETLRNREGGSGHLEPSFAGKGGEALTRPERS